MAKAVAKEVVLEVQVEEAQEVVDMEDQEALAGMEAPEVRINHFHV